LLGNRTNLAEAQAKSRAVQQQAAAAFAANVVPVVREIQASGIGTLRGIAKALTARGIATARGGAWDARTVADLLARAAA
jgi:hypothetical protein